jgi:hypothetical protein
LKERILKKRREGVFGIAVMLAGIAITTLCLMPYVITYSNPQTLLPTFQQEKFFFDLFGIVCGCWLLSWVCAVNEWEGMSRVGQWLGITLLCVDEAIMLEVWSEAFRQPPTLAAFLAPALVQTYLMGCFFAFFTLPALTRSGNRTLTGLGTLVLILPWLLGHESVVVGSEYLKGMVVK